MVERKSGGYAVSDKVPNKTSVLVSSAIVSNLKPLSVRVKTLTYDNGKEVAAHGLIDQQLNSTAPEIDWGSKHPQRCSINHSSTMRFEL